MALPALRRSRRWAGPAAASCVLVAACAGPASRERAAPPPAPPPGLQYVPPAPGSYRLPPIQDAADGEVVDADGTKRRLFDYLGDRYVLLSFVYTRCNDAEGCPLATAVLQMVRDEIEAEPELAAEVRLVSLSFDPARDTPEVMRRYAVYSGPDSLREPWDARPWAFLTAESEATLRPILDGYGQSIVREIDERGRPTDRFSHVLKVFLVDRRRRVRNIYSTSYLHPAIVVNDLKTLRMEEAGPS